MNKTKIISLISPAAFLLFGIWVRYSAASMTKKRRNDAYHCCSMLLSL